jgi:type II secretory pathway pseudopilin PulG
MDTQTAFLIISVTIAVVLYGGWMYLQRRRENKRVEAEIAAAEAKREARRRDLEAQARYDRTRRAAGLSTASDYTPRRSAPPPVSSPASVPHDSSSFGTSMLVAQATDSAPLGYMAGGDLAGALLGASMSSHHHAPSPAPAPSYDWGSSSSCDSSSSSSSYDSGSSSSSSCDSSSRASSWA